MSAASLAQFVSRSEWGRDLVPEALGRTVANMSCRALDAREFVYRKGEAPTHWIGVMEGLVKTCASSVDGRSTTISRVAVDGWVGEASLALQTPRQLDLVAMRRSRLACMPRDTFIWLCETNIQFSHFLNLQLARRMSRLARLIATERLQVPSCRVAFGLDEMLATQDTGESNGHLDISQEELAHLVGLSRQHTNRALHALEEAGAPVLQHGAIDVPDVKALRTIVP